MKISAYFAAIVAVTALLSSEARSHPTYEGWDTKTSKDEITDAVTNFTAAVSRDISGSGTDKVHAYLIIAECKESTPRLTFYMVGDSRLAPKASIEYRFEGDTGVVVDPDYRMLDVAAAIFDRDKVEDFIRSAIKTDRFIVRLRSLSTAPIATFVTTGAKDALDKALDGCGWYKVAP